MLLDLLSWGPILFALFYFVWKCLTNVTARFLKIHHIVKYYDKKEVLMLIVILLTNPLQRVDPASPSL